MRKLAILGIELTVISDYWDISLKDLAAKAIFAPLRDASRASVDGLYVGNMLPGS
jgi:acetyl-CoA acetyltransferase